MSGDDHDAVGQREAATDISRPATHPKLVPVGAFITTEDETVDTADRRRSRDPAVNLAGSFEPVDLAGVIAGNVEQPVPTMLFRRGDGIESGLIYPGMVNGVHGDSGTGKSWTAVLLMAERLALGETVLLLDLEDTPTSIVSRLRLIGVTDEQLVSHVIYIRPTDPFTPTAIAHLIELVDARNVTVVIIDSLGEAFGTEGINEDRDNEVGPWLRAVPRPLAAAGPAVLLVDHSTKSPDNPLHPSGSKRKRAAIGGASYLIEMVTGFAKGGSGRLRIVCAKDRHGNYRRGEHVAWLDMTSHPDNTATLELVAPAIETPEDRTEIVARLIVKVVGDAPEPVSLRRLRALVRESGLTFAQRALDDAVELAVHRGDIIEMAGPRNARLLSLPTADTP